MSTLLWGELEEDDFGKAKNIRQTEILVDLREAILKIARHFQSLDPKNNKVVIMIYIKKFFSQIFYAFLSGNMYMNWFFPSF